MTTSHELRDRFLSFFAARGHTVVPSDSLIPTGDPTVLFTSAGMNQFKDAFLGKRTDLRRAASCQKCMRAGDLDRVGKSASHHTFFEMLGNFSFGDYFKREAIAWAWEFLTGTLDFAGTTQSPDHALCIGLPNAKLWVSIYEQDSEAFELWRQLGVPAERIVRFGQEDNFWPSNAPKDGPNGPCGPCSEIYFDRDGAVNGKQSVEVWNLVFTQFDRQDGGVLTPLPRKNIDTGMGLERLTRVVQGVETDYETDLFAPIMQRIASLVRPGRRTGEESTIASRVVADHLRAVTLLLSEGILPSNESRGYLLRMLIRRAGLRMEKATGIAVSSPEMGQMLGRVIDAVIEAMSTSPYAKALAQRQASAKRVLAREVSQFQETLEAGTNRLTAILTALREKRQTVIPGEEAFELYDTYGLPVELTADLAGERGLTVDLRGFQRAMDAQRERSRAGSQFAGRSIFTPTALTLEHGRRSEFVGYGQMHADAHVQGIWKADRWVPEAGEGDEVGLVLDRSPFYGESGGQVGDRGMIEAPGAAIDVLETKWVETLLVHHARIRRGRLKVNEPVRATVDRERRLQIAMSHTAAHLLHWALRKVLGPETVQAGSLVEPERVRFDFSAMGGLSSEQQAKVEQLVNEKVRHDDPVQTDLMDLHHAKQAGALALFGEKYDQQVRVVSIADYSKELCGGTHLGRTGTIGTFRITAEGAVAAGTRRVEALLGDAAIARQQQETQTLRQIAQRLSRPPHEALAGLDELVAKIAEGERQIKSLTADLARVQARQLVAEAKRINGASLVSAHLEGADRQLLAALADAIKSSLPGGVVLLVASQPPATVSWVMAAAPELVKRGVHAGQMLKTISAITEGGGGGRPEFAQAGGKNPSKIREALVRAEALVREALERA